MIYLFQKRNKLGVTGFVWASTNTPPVSNLVPRAFPLEVGGAPHPPSREKPWERGCPGQLRSPTDPLLTLLLTPLLTPLKNIQRVVQIKFINITLSEVPRMAGECCNGQTSIFFFPYRYRFRSREHKIS